MRIATVFLAGSTEAAQIPGFLRLGAVVVIAPDPDLLVSWQLEQIHDRPPVTTEDSGDVVVQPLARRAVYRGRALPLTELEYRVLAVLAAEPDRARSFHEIRCAAWGEGPDVGDVFSVRSVVQRLRRKLRDAGAPALIESVRGYGFRFLDVPQIVDDHRPEGALELARPSHT